MKCVCKVQEEYIISIVNCIVVNTEVYVCKQKKIYNFDPFASIHRDLFCV